MAETDVRESSSVTESLRAPLMKWTLLPPIELYSNSSNSPGPSSFLFSSAVRYIFEGLLSSSASPSER
jgi:hypothetical protein